MFTLLANGIYEMYKNLTKLENVLPKIPLKRNSDPAFRDKLPVYVYHDEIINMINSNRMVFICGEAGTGKTTQVKYLNLKNMMGKYFITTQSIHFQIGQFILDYYHSTAQNCRILFAVPTDLIVYYTAIRTAKQRGENVGNTVGYETFYESMYDAAFIL